MMSEYSSALSAQWQCGAANTESSVSSKYLHDACILNVLSYALVPSLSIVALYLVNFLGGYSVLSRFCLAAAAAAAAAAITTTTTTAVMLTAFLVTGHRRE